MPIIDQHKLLEWLKPETRSQYELSCAKRLAAIDFDIYTEKVNLILEEAMEVFIHCGISDLTLSGDVAIGLYTSLGDLVASNAGSYLHVVSSILPIKYIMNYLYDDCSVGVNEGDFFFSNDPLYGSIHNPDQMIMMPIFFDGHLVAWVAAIAHTSETGAMEPGGMPVNARSCHDEGMKIPPTKIGEKYAFKHDILQMLENYMLRSPRTFLIELRARVSACDRVRVRLEELLKKKGVDFLVGLFHKIMISAESSARQRISGWNDGKYRAVVFTDSIGLEEGLQRVCLTLTKADDTLHFDFSGTSPEHEGSYHAFSHVAVAHAGIYLFGWPFYDLPRSIATLASCTFHFPPGTVLSPRKEAASSNSVMIGSAVMCLLPQCFGKLMFDSPQRAIVGASMGNTGSGLVLSGVSQWSLPFSDMIAFPLNTEGGGGRLNSDGVDAMGFPWCQAGRAPNLEDTEYNYPIVCITQKYDLDSAGFGKYRGGSGTQLAITPLAGRNIAQMSISKNTRLHTTQGLFGGYPPRVISGIIIRNSDLFERWSATDKDVKDDIKELIVDRVLEGNYTFTTHYRPTDLYHSGDIFVEFSSGGAGYGDVLEREPEHVLNDLKNKIISHWVAKHVYKVSVNTEKWTIDWDETNEWRKTTRIKRCQLGQNYQTFVKRWSTKQPSAEILKYYGSWPDAKPDRSFTRI